MDNGENEHAGTVSFIKNDMASMFVSTYAFSDNRG